MGTYRQPGSFVNTESAKYYRDFSNKMAGIADDIIASAKEKRKEDKEKALKDSEKNQKTLKAQNDYYNKTGNKINGVIANQETLFNDESRTNISNAITKAGDIKSRSGGILTQAEQNYLVNIDSLSGTISNNISDLGIWKESYTKKTDNINEMGGYSNYNDANQFNWVANVMGGGLKGKTQFSFDADKVGSAETFYKVTDESGHDFTFTGSMIKQIAENPETDILVSIPDERENMTNMVAAAGFQEDIKGKKSIQDIYFEGQTEKSRVLKDGSTEYYIEANKELLAENMKEQAIANVEALSKNEQLALHNYFQDKRFGKDTESKSLYGLDYEFDSQEEKDDFLNKLSADYATYSISTSDFAASSIKVTGTTPAPEIEEEELEEPLDPALTAWIDDINIETVELETTGEGGELDGGFTVSGEERIDLDNLEKQLQGKMFNISDQEAIQDEDGNTVRQQFTLTKYSPSRKRDIKVTINSEMTVKQIKNILRSMQTNTDVARVEVDQSGGRIQERSFQRRKGGLPVTRKQLPR